MNNNIPNNNELEKSLLKVVTMPLVCKQSCLNRGMNFSSKCSFRNNIFNKCKGDNFKKVGTSYNPKFYQLIKIVSCT